MGSGNATTSQQYTQTYAHGVGLGLRGEIVSGNAFTVRSRQHTPLKPPPPPNTAAFAVDRTSLYPVNSINNDSLVSVLVPAVTYIPCFVLGFLRTAAYQSTPNWMCIVKLWPPPLNNNEELFIDVSCILKKSPLVSSVIFRFLLSATIFVVYCFLPFGVLKIKEKYET